jgi:hypothetical protein
VQFGILVYHIPSVGSGKSIMRALRASCPATVPRAAHNQLI